VDNLINEPALERGIYSIFHQNFVSWRQASISGKLIDLAPLQLPNNSILHLADQFLTKPITSILPNLDNPFIKNETYVKYLEFVLTIPGADAVFPITEKYRFRPMRFNQEIRDFWIQHREIKRASSRDMMIHRAMTLPIINYDAILTAQIISGSFIYYRQFDLLFRTILNTVASIAGKHQWLQIPLSRTLYTKSQLSQTFEDINYRTVRIKNDPSFFFLIQLINFVSKTSTNSLFSQLSDEVLDSFNIIMTAGDKAIIYNLGDLKAIFDSRPDNNFYQMVLRHVNTLKLAGYAQHDISELDEDAYTKLVEDVAPNDIHPSEVESHTEVEPKTAILKIVDTKLSVPEVKVTAPISPTQPIDLKSHSDIKTPVLPKENHSQIPPKTPTVHDSTVPVKTPNLSSHLSTPAEISVKPESTTIPQVLPQAPKTLIAVIDQGAHHTIMTATHLTEDQKTTALKVAQIYKTLKVDGVTIEEHLQQSAEPKIGESHLEFLHDNTVDKSMLKSTVIDLDNHYLKHTMAKDLSSIIANMATNGMFLTKVEQHDEVTQLNRIRHYKTVYQDLTGRHHTVQFKFPVVSSDGTIMINGIESRMIKQQVNLPICKIDSNRVSLASSYNKTLVERVGTKAHNFNAYITRYISAIYKAQVGLTIGYGGLTTSAKLPYDYSSLAARYSTLDFKDTTIDTYPVQYRFIFDYDKRFDIPDLRVGTEAMRGSFNESALLKNRQSALETYEKHYGVYCGTSRQYGYTYRMFFGYDNIIRFIGPNRGMTPEATQFAKNFTTILFNAFADLVPPPKPLSEWTELKILDKVFPVVFILGFEYGLQRVLDHLKLDFQWLPSNTRINRTPTTIVIPFADGNLVFDRYPLLNSFIVAGLLKFDTRPHTFDQFNHQDVYYALLRDSGISLNYLKGISDFFKLFIDPITRDVLIRMREPTEVGRLLVRATEMLTTEDAIPSASMANHRLRGYERFTTTLYNEMARSYAAYSKQRGNRKSYSINPEAVFLRLIQDQTLHIVEEINPVENVKDKHAATYSGSGGRTAQSFVIEDRQFPDDGIGVLSEATPYSSKVAINSYVTANPLIDNIRGMFALDNVDINKLEPSQILSTSALLMPCSTNDDRIKNCPLK
jgi:hypothetical protein